MSSIASFLLVQERDLPGLRQAATPERFWKYVEKHGKPTVDFGGSGHIFGTLFCYLEERRGVDLMKAPRDDLASFLPEAMTSTVFLFTGDHRERCWTSLDPASFDQGELRSYYEEFTETDEPEAGAAMLDGIKALHDALGAITANTVVVFHVG
jgi:hypothetical protein